MCYSGILINKGTVKIADRQTAPRYMINLALLVTERAFSSARLGEAIGAISLTDYREFSSSDGQIIVYVQDLLKAADQCSSCSAALDPNAKFCSSCGAKVETGSIIRGLLEEPVGALSISDRLLERVRPIFATVGSVVQATREEIMRIRYIKEVRSRIIKNAADEFISG
jgi:hypothetical protein